MISLSATSLFTEEQRVVLARYGVRSVTDLLRYLPRRHIDRSRPLDLKEVRVGDVVSFIAEILHSEVRYGRRRRLSVVAGYQGFRIELNFYSAIPYYSRFLSVGKTMAFSGKLEVFRSHFSMTHPEAELIEDDDLVHTGKIVPVYKITEAMRKVWLTSRVLRSKIHSVLNDSNVQVADYLNPEYRQELGLVALSEAFRKIHYPEDLEDVGIARKRLAFDEILGFRIILAKERAKKSAIRKAHQISSGNINSGLRASVASALPFRLTRDQANALEVISAAAARPAPFAMLLQGDVGSGKTIVALLIALMYADAGFQVALLAPTEILARQHYQTFAGFTSSIPLLGMELLLGGEKVSERNAKLDRIKRGDSGIVIGTHALIQKDVEFRNLALAIIDEQHRFGVDQRASLLAKGKHTDLLSMTATPIPRSLAFAMFGDLEPVVLSEKPPGRKPVDTRLFQNRDLPRIYKSVRKYADAGRQIYLVYPAIEGSEDSEISAVLKEYDILEREEFPGYRLGLLHGRLNAQEKDRAMRKFSEGTIQILVSTTVVEVGVDVPNANVMVIRDADRFGLAQLHQLRGRVGRGAHQSYCILVTADDLGSSGRERLTAMLESEDGFYLARKDLEFRGTGELLGIRQAGMNEFRVADLRQDIDLLEKAEQLLNTDPGLTNSVAADLRPVKF